MPGNSSEVIRRRLLKNASSLLGMEHSELATLDPIVNMLYGALSKELEKLYHEQETSKSRVLDRLSKLLLPEVSTGAFPSHGVVHTRPYEDSSVLPKTGQFYYRKKRKATESSYRDDFIDVYFAPIDDVRIVNTKIDYVLSNSGVYKTADVFLKERISDLAKASRIWSKSSYWVALDVSELKEGKLGTVSLFIDWPAHPERTKLLEILPYVRCFVSDRSLEVKNSNECIQTEGEEADVLESFGLYSSNQRSLRAYYQKHFLSFELSESVDNYVGIPDSVKDCLDDQVVSQIEGERVWVKLEFPPFISGDLLDEMVCVTNAVPVSNLKMNEFSFRIQPNFNIVPLEVIEEFFYQIISVKSTDGKEYVSSSVEDSNKIGKGEYIVRRGGVERFDTRNASELLNYLLDLLKDESASFSVFGHEAITTDLNALNQQIASLNRKVESKSTNAETANYIMVQPRSNTDTVFVEYWTTIGEVADNVKLGTPLLLDSNVDVRTGELVLLTNTSGGKDPLSTRGSLKNFKSALTNRNRIVTKADIVSFCEQEMGSYITDVDSKIVFDVSSNNKSGFEKKMKIILTTNRLEKRSPQEWDALVFNLQAKIVSRSPFVMPIDIVTRHEA